MTEKAWKRRERRVAEVLRGQRTSLQGRSSPDVSTSRYKVEVKTRRKLPRWIVEGLATAQRHCGESDLGLLVLHELGAHNDLVVLRLKDFIDWFGEIKRKER